MVTLQWCSLSKQRNGSIQSRIGHLEGSEPLGRREGSNPLPHRPTPLPLLGEAAEYIADMMVQGSGSHLGGHRGEV